MIESEIEKLIDWEKNYRSGFSLRGLKETELSQFNDSILREKCFGMILSINDRLIEDNKTIIEKISNGFNKTTSKINSFVGIITKKN